MKTIALVPAAGEARRLGDLPGSKELLPLWIEETEGGPQPRLATHFLLDRLELTGVDQAVFVVDAAKSDLLRFASLWSGSPAVCLVGIVDSPSVPHSLDRAYPFVAGQRVILGFPDVVFEPADAYCQLLERQERSNADVVLGLFPAADRAASTDMVEVGEGGRVLRIEVRSSASRLEMNWLLAVWGPRFTEFLHREVGKSSSGIGERQLGTLFQRALETGMSLVGVAFEDGDWVDLGTPEGLERMRQRSARPFEGSEPADRPLPARKR